MVKTVLVMSTDTVSASASAGSASVETVSVSTKDTPSLQPAKKDSTTELPMFDLGEAINFVSTIHEKALETAQMPQVATEMGYKNPSSTPFYRRCVASRQFGLMAKSGVELSARARSYLKPDNDNARITALRDAVMGIAYYADEVNRNLGKRLNVQFIANSFGKNLPITDGCALECARVFEQSLRIAGFLSGDGVVTMPALDGSLIVAEIKAAKEQAANGHDDSDQTHTLYLDKTKKRKFTVSAPLDVNPNEVKRIQKWLEVTLLMDWNEPEQPT